ncbi:MAG TPA: multidrug efflux RND transporter permease subunit [Rhodocyclaceae bacterium]|nr:multidrug efflux RND transporter permease subunit [Rhodocyclaceae bacterium]
MNLSALFIRRPVATTLVSIGVTLAGAVAFFLLPVSPLPQVDYPTISVSASLPGASPETMAATVATPLERVLGQIAGVTEMTSSSSLGNTRVTLQFDLSKDINAAARSVQAGINAARPLLPSGLPSLPTYRKVNPADSPIMILAMTSATLSRGQMYDAASTVLAQRLAQVDGIGQVNIGGSALPAVRIEVDPNRLAASHLGLDDLRATVAGANTNRPLGVVEHGDRAWQIGANDQARTATDYQPLIVRYQNNASVRLGDVAEVVDGVQDVRNFGAYNGKPAVMLILYRQPGANIIATVDQVRALVPQLQSLIPSAIDLQVVMDRTPTIRGSLRAVEEALAISVGLVILVVFLFLKKARAAIIPSVAVPVSLIGTFGVMYLCGYSIDNLSLMALTVATGFVVDDAIVVLENIVRHIEAGRTPVQAALKGAREIGFTVVSISLSLIAAFVPILMMGGYIGRLFREFAVVMAAAILVSLVVSLTLTPMMASRLLQPTVKKPQPKGRLQRLLRWLPRACARGYRHSLAWCLRYSPVILIMLGLTIALNVHLYKVIPKGFFPQQDTGRIMGNIRADQSISFQAMQEKLLKFMAIVQADPAVAAVNGFTGGSRRNSAVLFINLKPLSERKERADQVIARLRGKLAHEPGANLFLNPVQDIRIGGRPSDSTYQFNLQADTLEDLRLWEPRIRRAMMQMEQITDVSSDLEDKGIQTTVTIDRDAAAALGLNMRQITTALNNAFGQRVISTIYNPLNQYRVVLELAPEWLQGPETLRTFMLSTAGGAQVPLSRVARFETTVAPLSVTHVGGFPDATISFNLPIGVTLGQASEAILAKMAEIGAPTTLHGSFQGTAKAFKESMDSQPLLILAAIITIYLVLGMLYESLIHPITILSTLPSAGVGALLALMAFNVEFGIISLIGIILLIGIVKKNAIMMIDFAIDRQRRFGWSAGRAIFRAAQLRFRPIMMTTLAATAGAVPLALGSGEGAELRTPLGISVVGGLLVSQVLTLFTTPVVYLLMDKLGTLPARIVKRRTPAPQLLEGTT